MANLLANTNMGVGVQQDFYYQSAIYSFSPNYWHYKTNIALSTYIMFMIEAVGDAYGQQLPIRCAWTGYSYSYLAQPSTQNLYGGLSADGVYVSSDNYICIRATGSSPYFVGFSFNAYTLNPTGYNFTVAFTAASLNSTSGNYY
jgi:hypothetical protein